MALILQLPGNIKADREKIDSPPLFVNRYGNNLGDKSLPAWFIDWDLDKDGNIAIYEIRAGLSNKNKEVDAPIKSNLKVLPSLPNLSYYMEFDLDGDGYISTEEYKRKVNGDNKIRKEEEEEKIKNKKRENYNPRGTKNP